ncbi:MAG: hypothetical protein KF729_38350 [Sandaracinaceae bacterium]|nr:hypothetical protein [Sandaracinaceae bacterium]
MAFFVVLNGPRADEVLELDPHATLMLGGGPNNHVVLPDLHVADLQAQVYPAEGYYWFQDLGYGFTLVNGLELARAVHALVENDVVQLGRTFLRFCLQPPAAASAGGIEELRAEIAFLRDEAQDATARLAQLESTKAEMGRRLEAARSAESAAARDVKRLTRENEKITKELERARGELAAAGEVAEGGRRLEGEAAELRAELERRRAALAALEAEVAEHAPLREQVAALEAELARLRGFEGDAGRLEAELAQARAGEASLRDRVAGLEAERARLRGLEGDAGRLEVELADALSVQESLRDRVAALEEELSPLRGADTRAARLEDEVDGLRAELERAEGELSRLRGVDAARERLDVACAELRSELEAARAELEHARAEDAREQLASTLASLESARAALAALGVPGAATELPRDEPDDPGALLAGAELAPALARRLEDSLTRYAEREALRRLAGITPVHAALAGAQPVRDELRTLHLRATRLASALDIAGAD